MIPFTCIVQAGQVSADEEVTLRRELETMSQRTFDDTAHINWITVPENSGFTAGKPSTSVLVSLQSSTPLEQSDRTAMLSELCGICMNVTGRSTNEVVASVSDPMG